MITVETIRERHSVREYDGKPLAQAEFDALGAVVEECARESGLDIQLVGDNPEVFNVIARFGLIRGCRTHVAFVVDDAKAGDVTRAANAAAEAAEAAAAGAATGAIADGASAAGANCVEADASVDGAAGAGCAKLGGTTKAAVDEVIGYWGQKIVLAAQDMGAQYVLVRVVFAQEIACRCDAGEESSPGYCRGAREDAGFSAEDEEHRRAFFRRMREGAGVVCGGHGGRAAGAYGDEQPELQDHAALRWENCSHRGAAKRPQCD